MFLSYCVPFGESTLRWGLSSPMQRKNPQDLMFLPEPWPIPIILEPGDTQQLLVSSIHGFSCMSSKVMLQFVLSFQFPHLTNNKTNGQ